MTLKTTLLAGASLFIIGTAPASAGIDYEALAAQLQSQGYTHIEIAVGPTQAKVEAVRDGVLYETVYDGATGMPLVTHTSSTEEDPEDADEIEFDFEGEDFLDEEDLADEIADMLEELADQAADAAEDEQDRLEDEMDRLADEEEDERDRRADEEEDARDRAEDAEDDARDRAEEEWERKHDN